jgi:bacillolysin
MPRTIVGVACVLSLLAAAVTNPRAQQRTRLLTNSLVEAMIADGRATRVHQEQDPLLEDRRHERLQQLHRGVRVFGADVTRQTQEGRVVSVFGGVHDGIDVNATPAVSAAAAKAVVEGLAGAASGRTPELVVLPLDGNRYRLAWSLRVFNAAMRRVNYFVDAHTGELLQSLDETMTQSVGTGIGVNGDRKKVSAETVSGGFQLNDELRPPALRTFDMRGNPNPVVLFLNGLRPLFTSDIAQDSDNDWQDGAAVDAHVSAGLTYDYFFKVHGRRGLNNADSRILSIVHPVRRENIFQYPPEIQDAFFLNAGYYGEGVMVYGVGIPTNLRLVGGQWVDHLAGALDIVAHELTHGVTEYSSNLIYRGESGALNESFSDMMGTAIEFAYQTPGNGRGQADYVLGEDAFVPGGIRAMHNPAVYGDPDHYSVRYRGDGDNGGVHINSAIPNQVYYLAIEGGTNRTSGLSVQGVGTANRQQIEKAMYRAFVFMLPADATFSVARAATVQAARDLYGANSPAERALTEAWTALGVN